MGGLEGQNTDRRRDYIRITKIPLIAAFGLMLAGAPLIATQAQDTGPGTGSTATGGKDTAKPAPHGKKAKTEATIAAGAS